MGGEAGISGLLDRSDVVLYTTTEYTTRRLYITIPRLSKSYDADKTSLIG
jgi:hypothetical protein